MWRHNFKIISQQKSAKLYNLNFNPLEVNVSLGNKHLMGQAHHNPIHLS